MTKQQIRFCTTPDGVRIAYALVGEGPPVLYVNGWPEHLELEWEQPFAQAFLARLAQGCTLVRYDMRGSGLSDRDVPAVSLEDLDRDLETVANQIGAAQIPLLALGMLAGPLALRFAARSPNRITRVVVVGGFVQGEPILSEARRRGLVEYVRQFGFPHFDFVDGAGVQIEDHRGITALQQAGAEPALQGALLETMFGVDLRPILEQVRCPVLVMHAYGDPIVPFELGRELAASLPDATFHPIVGDTAAVWALVDQLIPTLREFLSIADQTEPTARLTPREREVLGLIADGLSNRQIAAALYISEKTVKSHIGSVFAKLGARHRAHAIALARRQGLAGPTPGQTRLV